MHQQSKNDSNFQKALRALPEGAVPNALDIKRCGLQTVVREESDKVR